MWTLAQQPVHNPIMSFTYLPTLTSLNRRSRTSHTLPPLLSSSTHSPDPVLVLSSFWSPPVEGLPQDTPNDNQLSPMISVRWQIAFHSILNQNFSFVIFQSEIFTFYTCRIDILTGFWLCLTPLCCIIQKCEVELFFQCQVDEGGEAEINALIWLWEANDMVD